MSDILNPRLLRMREALQAYNFNMKWVEGKAHMVADALSRAPVATPKQTDSVEQNIGVIVTRNPELEALDKAALEDEEYQLVIRRLHSGLPAARGMAHPATLFKHVWGDLSVEGNLMILEGNRIIPPRGERARLLETMHIGHAGIVKTKQLARSLYYWPGMNKEITRIISACDKCQCLRDSKPVEAPM